MYRTLNVIVHRTDLLYDWCDTTAHLANNLYNAALFRERQMMFSRNKEDDQLTDNEREIIEEVNKAIPILNSGIDDPKKLVKVPKSGVMSYKLLDGIMKYNKNTDYLAAGLPRQTAQYVLKHAHGDIDNFFKAAKRYKKDPSGFNGKPKPPKYKHKQGACSFDVTNQDAVVKQNKKGNYQLKLPLTTVVLPLGKSIPGVLKEVHVTPINGTYQISMVFDCDGIAVNDEVLALRDSKRVASVDIGVDNLMTVTNNIGLPSMIITGKHLKAMNQLYNKKIAAIVSDQTTRTGEKFVPTEHYYEITNKRNNQVNNYLFHASKYFIQWYVDNRIDTIVLGKNDGWKQEVNMGRYNNQTFVQIPFAKLIDIIHYEASRAWIKVILQEESYTSKASYLDVDYIPTNGDENKHSFSGKRVKRGLYRAKNGTLINADVNGSANIMRKALPGLKQFINYWQVIVVNPIKALSRPNPHLLPTVV